MAVRKSWKKPGPNRRSRMADSAAGLSGRCRYRGLRLVDRDEVDSATEQANRLMQTWRLR
jgi:hypothetical protein